MLSKSAGLLYFGNCAQPPRRMEKFRMTRGTTVFMSRLAFNKYVPLSEVYSIMGWSVRVVATARRCMPCMEKFYHFAGPHQKCSKRISQQTAAGRWWVVRALVNSLLLESNAGAGAGGFIFKIGLQKHLTKMTRSVKKIEHVALHD